ncbi:hypothetical protein QFC21_001534 [Naganishia friedmannii]|uniref:Uncharacterized protein n=1 Tax=Naganishia friedmannii TaxID=89922 RepID=A0ACC2W3V6_9TREE|nr:hypothetical protein QFC21_001534 [Naganishia friedmannii]
MSTEDLSEAFRRLAAGNQEDVTLASTTSNLPRTSPPRVVHPEPLPLRRMQALSRLTGMREETRSVDHSREIRHHLPPSLLPLRPISRNNRKIRTIAFARVRKLLAARRGASNLATRTDLPPTSAASSTKRVMSQEQPRRVRSAGPILGRSQEPEPEVVPVLADEESEWVDMHTVQDTSEGMSQELPDTSVVLTAGDGMMFNVPDYNVLKDASSWFARRIDNALQENVRLIPLPEEDPIFVKFCLDLISLPWSGTDVAISNLFHASPYAWSSFKDLMSVYCRFEKYDIQRACSFLRRILPSVAFTHPRRALKFALARGTMGDVAYAALRSFTLDIADTCGVAFWHSVSRARLRMQGLEQEEAFDWQAQAHYTFVRCVYEGSLQIFRCPEANSEEWGNVAQTFLEDMSGYDELQAMERGNDNTDDATPILNSCPQATDASQEKQERSMHDFTFPRDALNRYFLPTQRELIKHVKPVSIVSPDSTINHFRVHREGYSGMEQLGFVTSSPNSATESPVVVLLSIEGVYFKMPADHLARASPAFKALISISYPGAQVLLPASVLHLIIQLIRGIPMALTADIIDFFAEGEPAHASPLNALCHLYELAQGFQIPILADAVNRILPENAWAHPALALATAMQQVPYYQNLADAALRCFDARLADMCSFHFWRRICFTQSLKIHEVFFEEYEWQRSTHLRFLLAIYSEKHLGKIENESLADVGWDRIAYRFLRSMLFEASEIRQSSVGRLSRTAAQPPRTRAQPFGTTSRL